LLVASGLTDGELLDPEQDNDLPRFGIGLTDLVKGRAASSDSMLASSDHDVSGFVNRIRTYEPSVVAFNGSTVARVVSKSLRRGVAHLGRATWTIGASAVFTVPSSSAASCTPSTWAPLATKAEWWALLREFVLERRAAS